MFLPSFTINTLDQGCVLVRAIEAVDTMETRSQFEREVARLFRAAFQRRLQEIADSVSTWDVEQVLGTDATVY